MATKKSKGPATTESPAKDPAKVKSRGADTSAVASETSEKDEVCLLSFLNNGNEVTLTDGRVVVVRDLPFEAWLDGLSVLIPVLAGLDEVGLNEKQFVMVLARDETIRDSLYQLMHRGCDKSLTIDEIKNLGAKDSLRLLTGFKEVIDFDGVRELFTHLVNRT